MRRRTLTFGMKIATATATLAATLVLTAWYGLHTIGVLNQDFAEATGTTARKLELAGTLKASESDMAVGERGLLMFTYAKDATEAAASEKLFQASATRLQQTLAEIQPLLVTAEGKQVATHIATALDLWLPAYAEMSRILQSGDIDGATKLLAERIKPQYLSVGQDTEGLARLCSALLQQQRRAAEDQLSTSKWLMTLLLVVGGLAALAALATSRSVAGQLRQYAGEMLEGSRQVAAAAGQVASASQSLAQGTSQQAATLEETSSSTTEIAAITRKNAENTKAVAALMGETAQLVSAANHNLGEMVESMKEINGSSSKISKIIRVIDEIAFQTNILALNAAVEAARAGEAGMGFAVVADEVRNLAQRSAQAARDTALLIEESIAKSSEGSTKLDQVAQSIRQITGSSTQVKTLVDEVNAGSQEQSRGIEQISSAVGQMDQVTQRSAANAEESAAASEELASQAQSLYNVVERLRTLVGQDTDSVSPASAAGSTSIAGRRESANSADMATLSNSLRNEHPAAASVRLGVMQDRASFPLDSEENGF
jgi:methyl-accepting chemotaxis protein